MRKVHIQALAEVDLVNIWQYTFEKWDGAQADKYLDELDGRMRSLAYNPNKGTKRENVRSGYRVLLVGSHAIYYTSTETAVHIIRVLHGRMDPDSHFD
jgi:toxin ParE1/3/4